MSSVTHLTQHLLKLDPQRSVARQALYNYLRTFHDGQAVLSSSLLQGFFQYILNFQYWQTNPRSLGESTRSDLESFSQTHRLDFELSDLRFPDQFQLITLEFHNDFLALVDELERQRQQEGDRHKIIGISEQQNLVVQLKASGGLEARVYNRVTTLANGHLTLLAPVTDLKYNSALELLPNVPQLSEGPMITACRFRLTEEGLQGLLLRGHMLQKYETLNGGNLVQHGELFYGLKRIERFFINPQSDPYFRDLVAQLERAYQMLNMGHPEARKTASSALQRGKAALKNIFPNDKLLTVLVTNIEFSLLPQTKEPWNENAAKP